MREKHMGKTFALVIGFWFSLWAVVMFWGYRSDAELLLCQFDVQPGTAYLVKRSDFEKEGTTIIAQRNNRLFIFRRAGIECEGVNDE